MFHPIYVPSIISRIYDFFFLNKTSVFFYRPLINASLAHQKQQMRIGCSVVRWLQFTFSVTLLMQLRFLPFISWAWGIRYLTYCPLLNGWVLSGLDLKVVHTLGVILWVVKIYVRGTGSMTGKSQGLKGISHFERNAAYLTCVKNCEKC